MLEKVEIQAALWFWNTANTCTLKAHNILEQAIILKGILRYFCNGIIANLKSNLSYVICVRLKARTGR